jgi:hypothetical protein
MRTTAIEQFFQDVAHEEHASVRGFMTACSGGSLDDNPFDSKSRDRIISMREAAGLKDAWNRAFIQAQHRIMDASTALAILDFVLGDRLDYLDTISEFEMTGVLRDNLMLGFGHLSDAKREMAAAI